MHIFLRIGDTEIKDTSETLKTQMLTATDGKRDKKELRERKAMSQKTEWMTEENQGVSRDDK